MRDDAEAVAAVIVACDVADYGRSDVSIEDVRNDWQQLDFDLARDAWVVLAPDGKVAGYAEARRKKAGAEMRGDGYVHPAHAGLGIGTYLVQRIEARARERVSEAPPGGRVIVTNAAAAVNLAAQQLFLRLGYAPRRHFWRMEIALREAPPMPEWPAGVTVRPFAPGRDDRAVHTAIEEAFADHWSHFPAPFEAWEQHMIKRESFDPALWFLAVVGDEIAGAALCFAREDGGWIDQLAVRRAWRRRGLGLALLRHAISELYQHGERTVALMVDAQNLTGATRLYERVGMRVARQFDAYAKELRAGRDPAADAERK